MAVDLSAEYIITAPSGMDGRGEVAVLNNPASGNFVGYLFDSSGFDSPEVRENADNIVEGDGGVHGSFYYGRRPFTLDIWLALATTSALSMARLDKLYRATNAMRGDGTITWTEAGVAKMLSFRRQQPLRGPSQENRCLFGGVSANPRILQGGTESNSGSASTSPSATNAGTVGAQPRIEIASPSATVNITNSTTSQTLQLTGLDGSGTLIVDFAAKTITRGGVNKYSKLTFPTSVWWELAPGANSISLTNAGIVYWRNSWL